MNDDQKLTSGLVVPLVHGERLVTGHGDDGRRGDHGASVGRNVDDR